LLDVVAGIPEIFTPTADLFVPQMINLHHLGAISLSKGCYPGQEIVARSHYLGKVKRHLVRGRGTGRQCPEPGTALSAGPTADATEVGRVLSAYTDDEGGCRLLAVAQEAAAGRPVELGWKHVHGVNLIRLESFD
jgi:folate-binding protein YgfZ